MDVKISQLEAFLAVARLRSFTRAAELLHLSQPALTVQIKHLEESLGTRLLDRNTRSVTLTRTGRDFAPVVNRMLSEMEVLISHTRKHEGELTGCVAVAAITSVSASILPAAIGEFRKSLPGVSVEIRDDSSERVLNMVRDEKVDFGIAGYTETSPDFEVSFFFRDRLIAVIAPQNPLARERVIRLKALATQPLIAMHPETSNRRLLDAALEEMGYPVKPAYEVSRTTTAVALAEAGVGIAILPSMLFRGKKSPHIVIREIRHPALFRHIGIIQKFGRPLTPQAATFLRFLKSSRGRLDLDTRRPH